MYKKTVLGNGIRVLSTRMPHTHSVSICIFVGAGSRYEEDPQAGISHFVEHMLFKGTPRRPSGTAISSAIEGLGGIMNGSTDREISSFWCKIAKPHFLQGLDVLTDLLRFPNLDATEMENERSVIQEELGMSNDYPGYRVDVLIDDMLWPNQPLGRDVGGSKESVQGISHGMLVDYYSQQYVPSNIVISIAGDVSHRDVLEALGPMVDGWKGKTPLSWHPSPEMKVESPQLKVEWRSSEQAHLCLGLPGIHSRHPDRYALDLMNTILGEGMSSRLFTEVREKRGLAYDIHSSVNHFRDTGSIMVYSGVDHPKAAKAVETILTELEQIKEGVPQDELDRGRELAKGRLLLRMEDTRAVASWSGAQEMLHDQILTVDNVVQQVDLVKTSDVERVAIQFLDLKKLNLAVVGRFRSDRRFKSLLGL